MSLTPERVAEIKALAKAADPEAWEPYWGTVFTPATIQDYVRALDPATVSELCEAWESLNALPCTCGLMSFGAPCPSCTWGL